MLDNIKRVAVAAVEATNPVNVLYGTVENDKPIEIRIHEKLKLTEEFLILTESVKDHEVEMTVEHLTESRSGGSGEAAFASHTHEYKGKKVFTVHNSLKIGELVVLLRVQGGHEFIVLDRVKERRM